MPNRSDYLSGGRLLLTLLPLLTYPYFNKYFKVRTDAKTFQLEAVLIQDCKPITYYSGILTNLLTRYTVKEMELLSIFGILKRFRTILLG